MQNENERWALFWCNLLHEVIFGHVETSAVGKYLQNLSQQEHLQPNGKYKKISYSTLRRKLKNFKEKGFEGLYRQERNDKGKIRAVDDEILARAIELKKEQPYRSEEAINLFLKQEFGKTIARSTLYTHLRQAGITKTKLGINKTKVRKRWTRDESNDLWMIDFEHGPYVMYEDCARQAYLSLCIDCFSRFVVHGQYYLNQNFEVVIDTLLRSWATYGLCRQVYLDNAQVYKSDSLQKACYDLGVELIYRPVRDPATGGLVERMFSTIQGQFEKEVRAGRILTLEELNKAFSAYLHVSYHKRVHSETKQAPKDRYQDGINVVRRVDINRLNNYFLKRDTRTVHRTFSDIQLHGLFFRVDPRLRGDRVEVRYQITSDLKEILVYSLKGEFLGKGTLHHRTQGIEPVESPQQKPLKYDYTQVLLQEHQQQIQNQASGIDFASAQKKPWGFKDFLYCLAILLGRKGTTSAFNTQEFEFLSQMFQRFPTLNQNTLNKAFEKAHPKTLHNLDYQLQILFSKE